MMPAAEPGRPGERGAAALEFALVAPVLFLLLFGGMEAGRLMFVSAAFRLAVSDSARCAELGRPECQSLDGLAAHAQMRLRALATPLPVPAEALAMAPAACGIAISARLPYRPLLLPLANAGITLTASACAAVPR
jgi:hypothetical protein